MLSDVKQRSRPVSPLIKIGFDHALYLISHSIDKTKISFLCSCLFRILEFSPVNFSHKFQTNM